MGKLAIPEVILNKPGKLTDDEFDVMKRHSTIGADLWPRSNFPIQSCLLLGITTRTGMVQDTQTALAEPTFRLARGSFQLWIVLMPSHLIVLIGQCSRWLKRWQSFRIAREVYDPLVVDAFMDLFEYPSARKLTRPAPQRKPAM